MRQLSEWLPRISSQQYLAIIVLSLVVLSCANLWFAALRYEVGLDYFSPITGPHTTGGDERFAPGREDRFADLIKISFSYRPFVSGITASTLSSWPEIFQRYYAYPVFGGKEALAAGKVITHFHVPPLMTLQFLASATLINYTQSILLDLAVFFCLYLAAVQCTLWIGVPTELRSWKVQLATWCFALFSYPALLVYSRGNFQAGFASLFIIAFLLSFFIRKSAEPAALLALALAVNFRPNAVIFALALPLVLGLKRSLRPFISFLAMAAGIFIASFLVVHRLYPDYTLSAFRRGLDIYSRFYFGYGGNVGNASLWAFVNNYITLQTRADSRLLLAAIILATAFAVRLWRLRRPSPLTVAPLAAILLYAGFGAVTPDYRLAFRAFELLSLWLVASAAYALVRCPSRTVVLPFLLTAFYCLFTPTFAEYHLLVFLGPLLVLYFNFHHWAENYPALAAITAACLLVMSPKNYFYLGVFSVQTVLNPLILYLACVFVIGEANLAQQAGTGPPVEAQSAPMREAAKV